MPLHFSLSTLGLSHSLRCCLTPQLWPVPIGYTDACVSLCCRARVKKTLKMQLKGPRWSRWMNKGDPVSESVSEPARRHWDPQLGSVQLDHGAAASVCNKTEYNRTSAVTSSSPEEFSLWCTVCVRLRQQQSNFHLSREDSGGHKFISSCSGWSIIYCPLLKESYATSNSQAVTRS